MTPAGIEPATFRFVVQHLNHCAKAVPSLNYIKLYYTIYIYVLNYKLYITVVCVILLQMYVCAYQGT